MNRSEAEAFSSGIGMVVGGSYMLILHAKQQGVPEALGMTLPEWVNAYLGGYTKMAIKARKEVVKELIGEGMSQRQIAEVVGVDEKTVRNDASAEKSARTPKKARQRGQDQEVGAEKSAPVEVIDLQTGETLTQAALEDDPRIAGSDRVRTTALRAQYSDAVYTITAKLLPLDPDVTARVMSDRVGTDRFIADLRGWLDRYEAARRRASTIHVVSRKEG